ncbi:reverse transcriptase domain-containing protein [Tanacetum coccineum]
MKAWLQHIRHRERPDVLPLQETKCGNLKEMWIEDLWGNRNVVFVQSEAKVSDDGQKFSKLDKFLVSNEFKKEWQNLSAIALDRKLSNHCPTILKDIEIDFCPKPFRVYDLWLKEIDIDQVVRGAWERRCVRPTFTSERIAKISAEDAGALERQFEEKEIWDAIYGCGSEKASGPDEFNFNFIKRFWDVLKSDLVNKARGAQIHWGHSLEESVLKIWVVVSSASSAVTYTSVYTDSEPGRVFWGADEEISDGGILRVIVYGYDGLLMQPAHDPDYVPEPIYPEYIPLEDEHEFSAEEQPLPPVVSPTAESPGYVTELDPEEDPEEYKDDETEDGQVDYPMDGGEDGDDDDDGDSSRDDADDEDEDEEEEEEHPAPADSAVVIPTDHCPIQAYISLPLMAEVERLLAMPTPSPSPPISLSPPSAGERLARCTAPPALSSPPLVPSPLLPSSGCPTQIQTLRIASIQALINAVNAILSSPSLPLLPPSLYIPPPFDRRDDLPESELPPRKRLCLSTLGSRYEIGESSTARPTGGEVNTRVAELAKLHERDTQDLYALLEDAQDGLSKATHQELQTHHNHVYAHETHIQAHQTQLQLHGTLIQTQHQVHETRFQMQQTEKATLRETDHRRLEQMVETLRVMRDMRREMSDMQAELLAHREQQMRARQPGPDARIPDHQDAFRDADSAALTWWNGQIRTLGPEAYSMTWEFVANETKKVDKYINELPENIYGNVKSARPMTLYETIELANDLMDQKLRTYAERQSDNKRKADDSSRNNHGHQQQPFKRQNVAKVYNMGTSKKRPYGGSLPKSSGNTNGANTQKGNGANQKGNVGNVEKKGNASRDPDSNVVTGTFLLNNHYASILFDTGVDSLPDLANRSILLEEDLVKSETEHAKAPVDFTTLQLHNLMYEKNHYVKAIKACKDFKSKYPDIELVPEKEFFKDAPEHIKTSVQSKDSAHNLMLQRLNFELYQRKELSKLHEKMEQQKKILQDTIANRKKFLSSLPSHLKSLKKASLPVQNQLGILHTKKLKQHQSADKLSS